MAHSRVFALGIFGPDRQGHAGASHRRDYSPAAQRAVGQVDASIGDLKLAQPASGPCPGGHQFGQKASLQKTMQDHCWETVGAGHLRIIVDFVEIARGARVLHELTQGRMFNQFRDLEARHNFWIFQHCGTARSAGSGCEPRAR